MDNPAGLPTAVRPATSHETHLPQNKWANRKFAYRTCFCVTRLFASRKKSCIPKHANMPIKRTQTILGSHGPADMDHEPSRIIVPGDENSLVPSEKFQRLFDEAQAMEREDAWQSGEVGFLSRASVQVTLPYRAPKGAPPVWTRTSGNISLMIQPGYFTQQRSEKASNGRQKLVSETVSLGYPYGSYPRLMLAWIGKEIMAKKKRGEFTGTAEDRRISLGNSLSEFMYNLGIPMATGGKRGTMTLVRQQMIRLFSATIAIVQNKSTPAQNQNPNHEPLSIDRVGYLLADQLSTWWDPMQPGQGSMFESFVVLSEPFFNELVNRPVPVDMRALKALKQSPFALDVYSWLTYRFFTIQRRTEIPWEALQMQFGTETESERKFRALFRKALKDVLVVYPGAKVDADSSKALILQPSRTSVRKLA